MEDNKLKTFLLGLATGMVFIPIIEEFMGVIMSWIQVLLLLPSKVVTKGNKEILDIQAAQEPVDTNCIGFQLPEEEYWDEDDE